MRIIAIDEDDLEIDAGDEILPEMRLILIDTDGQRHSLTLEVGALSSLAAVFRALDKKFPHLLDAH
jgi:hypothetical protein